MKATPKQSTATAAVQHKTGQSFFQKKGEESTAVPDREAFFSSGQRTGSDPQSDTPFFQKPSSPFVQTKLTVGQPGDPYEQEADAMADKVVQRLAENNQTNPVPLNGNGQVSPKIQRKPIFESNAEPTIQAKFQTSSAPTTPLIQAKCADCEQEEKLQKKEEQGVEEQVQMKPIFESNSEPPETPLQPKLDHTPFLQKQCAECTAEEETPGVQMQADSTASTAATTSLESRLSSSRGGGSPLSENTRSQMEGAFGLDFSGVRVHTDSSAAQMNKDLGAQAFTYGSDVYFNGGKYSPDSTDGQKLLAHELTHTVQQGVNSIQTKPEEEKESSLISYRFQGEATLEAVTAGTKLISKGSKNEGVRRIQQALIDLGYDLPVFGIDGIFENETESTIKQFQTDNFLEVDGDIGPKTLSVLDLYFEQEPSRDRHAVNGRFIVKNEDTPTVEQMRKSEFLQILDEKLCNKLNEAFIGTRYTANNCIVLKKYLELLQNRTPRQIERNAFEFAAETKFAPNIQAFIAIIENRTFTIATYWIQTGKLIDLHPEIIRQFTKAFSREVTGMLFKGKEGGARQTRSPLGVMQSLGKGKSLDSSSRGKMEGAFGSSFSNVELHTDSHAANLSSEMNARAFTVGNHIAFGSGEYQPGNTLGDSLIAHELAHVQQQKPENSNSSISNVSENDLENNANSLATTYIVESIYGKNTLPKNLKKGYDTKRTGLQLQRCSIPSREERSLDVINSLGTKKEYSASQEDIVKHRKLLKELGILELKRRDIFLTGKDSDLSQIDSINKQIEQKISDLKSVGLNIENDQLLEIAIKEVRNTKDKESNTNLLQSNSGYMDYNPKPIKFGDKVSFNAQLNYIPPKSKVRESRWVIRAGMYAERLLNIDDLSGSKKLARFNFEFDEFSWNLHGGDIEQFGQMAIDAYFYLDNDQDYFSVVSSGPLFIGAELPSNLNILIDNPSIVPGTLVNAKIINWAPPATKYIPRWYLLNENGVELEELKEYVPGGVTGMAGYRAPLQKPFLNQHYQKWAPGKYYLNVKIFERKYDGTGSPSGVLMGQPIFIGSTPLLSSRTSLEVKAPDKAASEALEQNLKQVPVEKYPSLQDVSGSIGSSIKELEKKENQKDENEDYYKQKKQSQTKRLESLNRNSGGVENLQSMPENPSLIQIGNRYVKTFPAGLFLIEAGALQPLNTYLIIERPEQDQYKAKILDVTGIDVYPFEGKSSTYEQAIKNAFDDWGRGNNPYPPNTYITHLLNIKNITLHNNFSNSSTWKTAKKWIDGILTIGGLIIAGLLLLVPEPSGITKVAALALAGAAIARGAYGIYENTKNGIALSDSRNVLEAIGILTTLVGLSGSALRGIGIQLGRSMMMRTGNYLLLLNVASDAGTIVFATNEAIEAIKAIKADPTLDETEKLNQILSIFGRLVSTSALIIASNKDFFKGGLTRGAFFRNEILKGNKLKIDETSRVDILDYLRKNDSEFNLETYRKFSSYDLVDTMLAVQVGGIRSKLGFSNQKLFDKFKLTNETDAQAMRRLRALETLSGKTPKEILELYTSGKLPPSKPFIPAGDKPWGLNMTLEEIRINYGEAGMKVVAETYAKAKALAAKAKENNQVGQIGPVYSGFIDSLTGETFFARNFSRQELRSGAFEKFKSDLEPVLKDRLTVYEAEVKNGKIIDDDMKRAGMPAAHSEIIALDLALKARKKLTGKPITEAELSQFIGHNRSLKNLENVPPKCVNCHQLAGGVIMVGND